MPARKAPLTVAQVLAWADAHHARTGRWPTARSGPVIDAPGETWSAVEAALRKGLRGLPRGDSLARLLAGRRLLASPALPPLAVAQILAWADAHFARNGRWPRAASGAIPEAPSESWDLVNSALMWGGRGLPGGQTLAGLLRAHGRGRGGPMRGAGRPRRR